MSLSLQHGLTFADLYDEAALPRLDAAFVKSLPTELAFTLKAAREAMPEKESDLILALAPHLDDFIAAFFGIEKEAAALAASINTLAPLWSVKRNFVQRRAAKNKEAAASNPTPQDELAFAQNVARWLENESAHEKELNEAEAYAAWALFTEAGRTRHGKGALFQLPKKIDPAHLLGPIHPRHREGFALTDQGTDLKGALSEIHYCIWCHHQDKDSCSKGLKKDGAFVKNASNISLEGCPLEEKISEMHEAKANALSLAALAIVAIDNPMCAATGHRICNDCMKACIYQKQQPVDIPQAETRVLKDVLALPWGFEIYSLLTRWNPLNFKRPLAKAATGYKVLVAGQGPAGFTLAHHLLNEGHAVFAIDGLKIEPLDIPFTPIRDASTLHEPLESRTMAGFGGVAEYGITVRWDKNFLKIIRLLLTRRRHYRLQGNARLGSQLTIEGAFEMGFDHIALCLGAGRPTVIDMPNNLAKGVRQASDFLMALQLTGAAKADSLANLELRLPVIVIGGGLTAIDTATEARAYYPVQVEKFLQRHEKLGPLKNLTVAEQKQSEEWLQHARALRTASPPQRDELIESWGGVTIAYRKKLTEAPAYRLNHEEVEKALEEGIHIIEEATPLAVEVDETDSVTALKVKTPTGEKMLPTKTILVAAGTQPNTVIAREDETFTLDGKYLRTEGFITHRRTDGRTVTTFGDMHPDYAGNVVKAMASATYGAPVISQLLTERPPATADVFTTLEAELTPTVTAIHRLTPTIIEAVIKAPAAAREFHPGQFFRLQNFEIVRNPNDANPERPNGSEGAMPATTRLRQTNKVMEALAMTGASVNKETGEISLIALEMGGSSNLMAKLKPGEPVALMGPTGHATEIPENETLLFIGGGLGNAVLFSIGQAARKKGCRVIYFAGYRKIADRYKVSEIEAAADQVVWCCDEAPGFIPSRPDDRTFAGNMLEALITHHDLISSANRILCIGSDRLMGAVAAARHTVLKPYLKPSHIALGSINSPMQCMMKEVCAQCLQRHIDPVTGAEKIVFSCFNQDQLLDEVDFKCLSTRLAQNSLTEKQTAAWIAVNA